MINTLKLAKTITDWQKLVEQIKSHLAESKSVNSQSSLSSTSKRISRLKKELDRSFPEFGDMQETLATYKLYRQLETLQQQIKSREE